MEGQYNPSESELTKAATIGLGGLIDRTPPVRKIVEARIAEYERAIKEHKALLEALDSNPGIETVLDKLRKIGI